MRTRETVERRKHRRYQLGVPVKFFWKDAQDIRHEGIGITHDISAKGMFVLASNPPPLECGVAYKAFLPPSSSAASPLCLQGQGQVVRMGAAHDGKRRAGFAVAGERFVLRRGEENLSDTARASRSTHSRGIRPSGIAA